MISGCTIKSVLLSAKSTSRDTYRKTDVDIGNDVKDSTLGFLYATKANVQSLDIEK